MKAGTLRHLVEIQRPADTQDTSTGAIVRTWGTFASVWASVAPLSAREFFVAQAEHSKVTARIVIRYRDDVDSTCRVLFRNAMYNIEGVLPDKESGLEYLTLLVSVGTRDA
jgi:SPP1 family predicted phage head-tail adaptor